MGTAVPRSFAPAPAPHPRSSRCLAPSPQCWVVVKDVVYDITDYLQKHPGGEAALSMVRSWCHALCALWPCWAEWLGCRFHREHANRTPAALSHATARAVECSKRGCALCAHARTRTPTLPAEQGPGRDVSSGDVSPVYPHALEDSGVVQDRSAQRKLLHAAAGVRFGVLGALWLRQQAVCSAAVV